MIIDGKAIASQIQNEIKEQVNAINGRKPCLAVILVGNNPASEIYVNRKTLACQETGILSIRKNLPADCAEKDLLQVLDGFNRDHAVDGILLQLPLPAHINSARVLQFISPEKDVDGLHPVNAGKLIMGDTEGFAPCTPLGIKVLLERSKIPVSGKHVVIMGRSNLVGKPMASLLMQNAPGANATVTVVHSKSSNLTAICRQADIIIAAIGQPQFLKADMVKDNVVVIDVGINKIEDASSGKGYRIVGDVDFDNVKDKCEFITPVPGGIGPMTIAMLLSNTVKSRLMR